VRREIRRALTRGIAIIPVLLEDRAPVSAGGLPPDIRELAVRQATLVRQRHRQEDLVRLGDSVARVVGEPEHPGAALPPADPRFPPDLPDFVNRVSEVRELSAYALGQWPVIVIQGMGGVGKSVLAVHLAHLLRYAWPDQPSADCSVRSTRRLHRPAP
jgi:hypothetical protein